MKNLLTIAFVLFYMISNAQTKNEQWNYIRRFVAIAKTEKQKFGIPISIILGQAVLESQNGKSKLAKEANNHFKIMTYSSKTPHSLINGKKYKKYESAWESFRDHSLLLMRDHHKSLRYLSKTDYINWAKGLQKTGYSNDICYAKNLIKIIENLQLHKLDEI